MNIMVPQVPQSWIPGQQIVNLGAGGPASHMGLLAAAPRPWPFLCGAVRAMGAMPRQVIGPTIPVVVNRYSTPDVFQNLEIKGIFKSPITSAN